MANESTRDQLTKSYAEMNELRIKEKKNQLETEFQRYRQGCRNKAMEFAMEEFRIKRRQIESTQFINKDGESEEKLNVIELADKYYLWLITIPVEFKEMNYQKKIKNPYPTDSPSFVGYDKGFEECWDSFFKPSPTSENK